MECRKVFCSRPYGGVYFGIENDRKQKKKEYRNPQQRCGKHQEQEERGERKAGDKTVRQQ